MLIVEFGKVIFLLFLLGVFSVHLKGSFLKTNHERMCIQDTIKEIKYVKDALNTGNGIRQEIVCLKIKKHS